MNRISLICHSVFVLVTFLTVNSYGAAGKACGSLFLETNLNISDVASKEFSKESFSTIDGQMSLLREGVLNQIRTSNPTQDHIEYFSAQLPLIITKLLTKNSEASAVLSHTKSSMNEQERAGLRAKKTLKDNLEKSFELLLQDSMERIQSKTVTYEWYMSFFLKSMIFSDVTTRIVDASNSKEKFEVLNRKIDTLLGRSKVFFSDDAREMMVYSSLGKEFASLTRDAYFTKYLPEHPILPVLFVPRASDIIEAEQLGLHFVSLVGARRDTVEGKKYPLKFAGIQLEQNLKQIRAFKSYENPKSKWLKYHLKISSFIRGDAALESLYAYILRDAGLQSALTSKFETGYKIGLFSFDAHMPSQFLKAHFAANQSVISPIASQKTIDAFLKVISKIEQEALASKYKN